MAVDFSGKIDKIVINTSRDRMVSRLYLDYLDPNHPPEHMDIKEPYYRIKVAEWEYDKEQYKNNAGILISEEEFKSFLSFASKMISNKEKK